jgi:hypothetical protein
MCGTRVRIVIAPSSARGSVCEAVEHPFANFKWDCSRRWLWLLLTQLERSRQIFRFFQMLLVTAFVYFLQLMRNKLRFV